MPFTDMEFDRLQAYAPDVAQPADFDAFWATTLDEARRHGIRAELSPADTPITSIRIEDLTFAGYAGEPIKGWVARPLGDDRPRPTVIEYIGYNGGRGLPGEKLLWASAGYVHVVMDTRGQGSGWGSGGDTPDPYGSEPSAAGFMTRGVLRPEDYYYRRLFTDGVRLVDTARTLPFVDPERIAVTGASQGGGIALAVAALVPDLRAVMPDVPFLCHFRRSVELTPEEPFTELTRYLATHRDVVDRVFQTLSYFDGVNFARRTRMPALFSVALMDDIVLPSTVYAAYNAFAGAVREIEVYPFNGHEGGGMHQWVRQAAWLPQHLG